MLTILSKYLHWKCSSSRALWSKITIYLSGLRVCDNKGKRNVSYSLVKYMTFWNSKKRLCFHIAQLQVDGENGSNILNLRCTKSRNINYLTTNLEQLNFLLISNIVIKDRWKSGALFLLLFFLEKWTKWKMNQTAVTKHNDLKHCCALGYARANCNFKRMTFLSISGIFFYCHTEC